MSLREYRRKRNFQATPEPAGANAHPRSVGRSYVEIFYPAFDRTAGEENEDDKELVLEAGEEHLQVKTLLAELSGMEPDDELFDAKMKVMKDNIDHHVEEEEGEMFPHAQKELSSDELEQLGQQMDALKSEIKQEGPEAGRKRTAKGERGKSGRTVRATSASRRADTSPRSRSAKPSGVRSARPTRSAASRSKSSRPSRSR